MKTVLITGGSGGIGASIARGAAKKGWGVFVGYGRNREKAEALAQDIMKSGGKAWSLNLPLEDPRSVGPGLDLVQQKSETLNALVLCASPAPVLASFLKTEETHFLDQFRVNAIGNHRLISETWKRFFRKNGGGHVIGLLSEAMGTPPWPHMASYVMGKRALQCLLECALAEFGNGGLRVSAVSPDYTSTPMLLGLEERVLEAARLKRGERFLEPAEVAEHVLDCLENPPADPILVTRRVALSPIRP